MNAGAPNDGAGRAATLHQAAAAKYPGLSLYIDGQWLRAEERPCQPVFDPGTECRLGQLPLATDEDLDKAIAAAARGFEVWRRVPAVQRARVLVGAAAWLRERRAQWAELIALELGKPLSQASVEVETACEMLEWAAAEGRRLYGRQIPERVPGIRMQATLEPVGPVAAIAGWNAPAVTPTRKISGALAAGCSLLIKPSEATPASALMIARALEFSGLPAGVLNVIFGDPARIGLRMATDPVFRALTFTGGIQVGKQLAAYSADTLKKLVLELGGHAPLLVFDGPDIAAIARAAVAAKFRNGGQVCTSPTRIWIQNAVYDRFVDDFCAALQSVNVVDPFDADCSMGPLQNSRRVAAIRAFEEDARQRGAQAVVGSAPTSPGYWQAPTALLDVPLHARVLQEEPFGPLAVLGRFRSMDEALAEANRLPFGLAAYAFTQDLATAERLGRDVRSGSLAINHWSASFPETPFGGVRDSGIGSEGGSEGVAAFTVTRFVSVSA